MANRPGPLQVHIFRDGEFLGTDVFAERQIVVGRDPDEADLVLESSQVSRRHAIIENDGGKVTVRDAGSTNGVFLNADKVVGSVEVTRLDEIRIGEFALKLKFASKTKGEEAGPEKRPGDSTREIQALSKSGAPANLPRDERTGPAMSAREVAQAAAPPRGGAARVEVNTKSRMPAAHDLSEFDDEPDDPGERSTPRAEFRKRDEPVDRDKLGDMLAGIGIAEPGVNSATTVDASPLPMAPEPKKRPAPKGGKAASGFADLAAELEGDDEPATQTNISGLDPNDFEETRREESRRVNGKGVNGGARNDRNAFFGAGAPHAHGPAVSRSDIDPESIPSAAPVQARGMPKPPDMLGLDSDPMSPFEPHADLTHDDDHDEDDDYVPAYSLAQHILGDEVPPKQGVARVEVLAVRDDVVDSVALLAPGESYWIGPESAIARLMSKAASKEGGAPYKPGPRFELVKHKRPGEVEVEFKKDARGMVVRGGRSVELGAVQGRQGRKQVRRGTQIMGLSRGEIAQVTDGPTTYHIRQIIAPAPLRDNRPLAQRIRPEKLLLSSSVGALGTHLVIMVLMSFLAGPPEMKEKMQEEFVEVTIEPEMKLEEPPKPPEPPAPEPVQEPKPVQMKQPKMKQPKVAAEAPAPPNPAPVGVLGLLNKKGPTQAPGPAAAVAAISNLAAAKTPTGSSGYKVSGLIGKLPTSDLSIGGGGGGPMTKGAAALLRGGAGGAGVLSGKTTGQVRSLVTKMPQGMHAQGGSLDREEIQKVVNKHIGEIQRCYERELLKTPTLAGKVTLEWVVGTSGAVKSSRQKDATLQSASAVNCMLASVKGWQFPQPRGGEVVVSYPFNFAAIGM